MRQQLIPSLFASAVPSLCALACGLAFVALIGAPCPIAVDESECSDNHDCDDDEECNSGHCDEADGEGEGAEGEGEGDAGEGEGEGDGPRPSDAQVTAYCTHVAECLTAQGTETTPDECIQGAQDEFAQTTGDPTCAAYNSLLVPVIVCFTGAPCETFFDGTACPDEIAAVEAERANCAALSGG